MARNTPREINPDDAHSIAPDIIAGDEARAPAKDEAERLPVESAAFAHSHDHRRHHAGDVSFRARTDHCRAGIAGDR